MAHVPLHDARYESLAEDEQATIDEFIDGVKNKTRFGLWVCGPRNSGTTYVGRVAVKLLGKLDDINQWEHFYAFELLDEIRHLWTLDTLVRANPNDYALWTEWSDRQAAVDYVWQDLDVLFLNDLHGESIDINFWRKHVQERIEFRLRGGRPTIIATDLLPDDEAWAGLLSVIERDFVVCVCAER